ADVILAIRHLARDTFRQSLSSGIFWVMLAVTAVCVVFCLSVSVSGDFRMPLDDPHYRGSTEFTTEEAKKLTKESENLDVMRGSLTRAFGAITAPMPPEREVMVHFLQLARAAGIADSAGLLLILVWTAGFLPSFLDPTAAAVLLAKPVPR